MGAKKILISSVVFVLIAANAAASSWDFNYKNLLQIRQGRNSDNQVPINQYVSMGLSELPRSGTFQADFRSFMDIASPDNDSFDLYQAVFHIEPVESLAIDGGRQWLADGFDGEMLDGAKFSLFPSSGYIGGSLYAGIPRYTEQGDFNGLTEGLLVGANLNLQNVKDTAAQFSVRWRKIDATKNDYKQNDALYVGLSGSRQFSNWKITPNLYGDVEYNIADKTLDAGSLGVDLYPHWRVALTLEGSYFDVSRALTERTVFANTVNDEIVQGRESTQIKLTKNLHFLEGFSYQHYSIQGGGGENGYLLSAGLDHWWDAAKLSSTGEYYYGKSFGGNVHGGLLELASKYFGKWLTDLSLDISRYSKVTGQKGTAVSLVGLADYPITERARLGIGGEFNRNNWFNHEERLTVNFEMGFDKAGYTPEKRSKKVNRRFHEI